MAFFSEMHNQTRFTVSVTSRATANAFYCMCFQWFLLLNQLAAVSVFSNEKYWLIWSRAIRPNCLDLNHESRSPLRGPLSLSLSLSLSPSLPLSCTLMHLVHKSSGASSFPELCQQPLILPFESSVSHCCSLQMGGWRVLAWRELVDCSAL